MNASDQVQGFDRLANRFRGMANSVAGPIAVKALRAGAQVQANAIKSISDPYVAASIGYRIMHKRDPAIMRAIVGVNVGRRATRKTRWAAARVAGTRERFRKAKNGRMVRCGRIVGTNVVERGLAASQSQAQATIRSVLKSELAKLNR